MNWLVEKLVPKVIRVSRAVSVARFVDLYADVEYDTGNGASSRSPGAVDQRLGVLEAGNRWVVGPASVNVVLTLALGRGSSTMWDHRFSGFRSLMQNFTWSMNT